MPSKIQLDENLWFLYICLQKSDMKSIDFNAVGLSANLKPPAARMRYSRLKRQIESGTLIGTHGTTFSPEQEKAKELTDEKTQRVCPVKRHEDDENGEDGLASKESSGSKHRMPRVKPKGAEDLSGFRVANGGIKYEHLDGQNDSEENSEDEIPLAKIRKCLTPHVSRIITNVRASSARRFAHSIPANTRTLATHTLYSTGTLPIQQLPRSIATIDGRRFQPTAAPFTTSDRYSPSWDSNENREWHS